MVVNSVMAERFEREKRMYDLAVPPPRPLKNLNDEKKKGTRVLSCFERLSINILDILAFAKLLRNCSEFDKVFKTLI